MIWAPSKEVWAAAYASILKQWSRGDARRRVALLATILVIRSRKFFAPKKMALSTSMKEKKSHSAVHLIL